MAALEMFRSRGTPPLDSCKCLVHTGIVVFHTSLPEFWAAQRVIITMATNSNPSPTTIVEFETLNHDTVNKAIPPLPISETSTIPPLAMRIFFGLMHFWLVPCSLRVISLITRQQSPLVTDCYLAAYVGSWYNKCDATNISPEIEYPTYVSWDLIVLWISFGAICTWKVSGELLRTAWRKWRFSKADYPPLTRIFSSR